MRILLILLVIIAVFVVVQAKRHGCKYDATLINCVLGKAETPTAETPPPPPPTARRNASTSGAAGSVSFGSVYCKAKPRAPGGVRGLFNCGPYVLPRADPIRRPWLAQRIGKIRLRGSLNLHLIYRGHLRSCH